MQFPSEPRRPPDLIKKFNDYTRVHLEWYSQGDSRRVSGSFIYVPLRYCAGGGRVGDVEKLRKYIYKNLKSKDNNLNHFYVVVQLGRFSGGWYVLDLRTGEVINRFEVLRVLYLKENTDERPVG